MPPIACSPQNSVFNFLAYDHLLKSNGFFFQVRLNLLPLCLPTKLQNAPISIADLILFTYLGIPQTAIFLIFSGLRL